MTNRQDFVGSDNTPREGAQIRREDGFSSRKRLRRSTTQTVVQETEPARTKVLLDDGNIDMPDIHGAVTRHERLLDAAREMVDGNVSSQEPDIVEPTLSIPNILSNNYYNNDEDDRSVAELITPAGFASLQYSARIKARGICPALLA